MLEIANGDHRELYKTDGNEINLVADLNATHGSTPRALTVFENNLFFFANANQMYKHDGITTSLFADLQNGISGTIFQGHYTTWNEQLVFVSSGQYGIEPYKTDGLSVSLLEDINPDGSSAPQYLSVGEETLFFLASDQTGMGLYATDSQTVERIVDLDSVHDFSLHYAPLFLTLNDKLILVLNGPHGRELYEAVRIPEPTSLALTYMVLIVFSFQRKVSQRKF